MRTSSQVLEAELSVGVKSVVSPITHTGAGHAALSAPQSGRASRPRLRSERIWLWGCGRT